MNRPASLRRQADFSRLRRRGHRASTQNLTIYRSGVEFGDAASRLGITVTRAVGKAVVRNQVRRRLAAIAREILANRPAMRLLVIAQPAAAQAPFAQLHAEVSSALQPAKEES